MNNIIAYFKLFFQIIIAVFSYVKSCFIAHYRLQLKALLLKIEHNILFTKNHKGSFLDYIVNALVGKRGYAPTNLILCLMFFILSDFTFAQESSLSINNIQPTSPEYGFKMDGYWVWGSSIVEKDGVYHMYATRVPKSYKFHPGWMIAAEIVYAQSDKLEGPYKFVKAVTPARGKQYWDGNSTYNPQIVTYNGKYYLFYGGTNHPFETPTDEELTLQSKWCIVSRFNKRIGLAIADSPEGPWVRSDKPIVDTKPETFYSYLTSNPAPVIMPNGNVYVLFKGRASLDESKYSKMQLGVAFAESPEAEYKVLNNNNPTFKLEAEDPFLWYENGYFHAVFKDHRAQYTGERGAGVKAYSKDCINWFVDKTPKVYSKYVKWMDGTTTQQGNLERAFIFFENGKPKAFSFATMGKGSNFSFGGSESWNIIIPLK